MYVCAVCKINVLLHFNDSKYKYWPLHFSSQTDNEQKLFTLVKQWPYWNCSILKNDKVFYMVVEYKAGFIGNNHLSKGKL